MTESHALRPGSLLRHDTYRIEKIIGQGGFGITYLATDLNLDRKVAIKEFFCKDYCDRDDTTSQVTNGSGAADELVSRLKTKFLKEARNIAKFDHPGIIRILACFEENNTAYYVMDYIEGESLSEMVKKGGALPEARAVEYIIKVGKALEYVHQRHINHLDIKPSNIMIRRRDDQPVLIDFGLSKQYDSAGNQTSTTPTGISHGYAPLEQYEAGGVSEFSAQTDLYSLAATLYYALTGVVPPQAAVLIDEDLLFPPGFPPDLTASVSKAMSPGRKRRHESVEKFLSEINKADSVAAAAHPEVAPTVPTNYSTSTSAEETLLAANPSSPSNTTDAEDPATVEQQLEDLSELSSNSPKKNVKTFFIQNWSWSCVFLGVILELLIVVIGEERFYRYNFAESFHVFFFDSLCWMYLLVIACVYLTLLMSRRCVKHKFWIFLIYAVSLFFLTIGSDYINREIWGSMSEMIYTLKIFLPPVTLAVWAYALQKNLNE